MRAMLPVVLVALTSCAHDPGPAAAAAIFAAFQAALLQGDEGACRRLSTGESAAALADIPWAQIRAQQPLAVRGARREGHEFRVVIADPNAGGSTGEFVVVRENGRLVVDLVASAGLVAQVVEAAGSKEVLVPRELTPADLDRIRLHDLAQPR